MNYKYLPETQNHDPHLDIWFSGHDRKTAVRTRRLVASIAITAALITGIAGARKTAESISSERLFDSAPSAEGASLPYVKIEKGGNLWTIAKGISGEEFNVNKVIHDIRKYNGIKDPGKLQPGDIIVIPKEYAKYAQELADNTGLDVVYPDSAASG